MQPPQGHSQTDKTLQQQHHSCPALSGMHVLLLYYREGVAVHGCTAAGCSNTQGNWIRHTGMVERCAGEGAPTTAAACTQERKGRGGGAWHSAIIRQRKIFAVASAFLLSAHRLGTKPRSMPAWVATTTYFGPHDYTHQQGFKQAR